MFASRRQGVFVAAIALAVASRVASRANHKVAAAALAGAAVVGVFAPLRKERILGVVGRDLGMRAAIESAQFLPLIVESARRRRLVL
jgi:hypothetical protein